MIGQTSIVLKGRICWQTLSVRKHFASAYPNIFSEILQKIQKTFLGNIILIFTWHSQTLDLRHSFTVTFAYWSYYGKFSTAAVEWRKQRYEQC
jgi:alpha-amylase/alpha-mannosidase (GH57 family)